MDSTLLDFLQSEYECGRFDSHGTFSLDVDRAKAKLARFQLADPLGFLLCWVRHAVCQGASRITVSERGGQLTFEHDGPCPTLEDLQGMYFSESTGLRELAVGILNACKPKGSRVDLVGKEVRARFDAAGQDLRADSQAPACTLTRTLKRRWFAWLLPRDKRARQLLTNSCRLVPLALWVSGTQVGRPLAPSTCFAAGLFRSRYGGLATQIPHRLPGSQAARSWDIEEDFSLLFLVGLKDELHGLIVNVNGVSYRLPLPWPLPRATVVLASPTLRLDLSGSAPLQDENFHTALRRCRHYLGVLLQSIESDSKAKQACFPYLQVLVTLYAGEQQFDKAYALCQKLRSWLDDSVLVNDASLGIFLYRYFLVARALGNHGLADPLRSLALTTWDKVNAAKLAQAALEHNLLPEALLKKQAQQDHLVQLLRFSLEEQMLGASAAGLADSLTQLANKAETSGDFEIAQFCFSKLVRLEQEPIALVHRHLRLGNILSRRARYLDSPELWLKARESFRAALALIPDDYDSAREERAQVRMLAQVLEGLAGVEAALGRLPQARELLERSLAYLGKEGGDALARRDILRKLGTVYRAAGDRQGAKQVENDLAELKLPHGE